MNIYVYIYTYMYVCVYIYVCIYIYIKCMLFCYLVVKSCLTLCNPMDYNLPGSSVHGISQARILEWVDIPFSTGSF